jgi:hydroxyethylthiazole kinase-like uncharacterized protein yjeF
MYIVTAAQMQAMDHHTIANFGIPGRVLMECAGRGAMRIFLDRICKGTGTVGIIAGRGNNGGDGFVMARYLAQMNIPSKVFLLAKAEKVQGDAAENLKLLAASNVPVVEMPTESEFRHHQNDMRHQAYWIDAVLGTGLNADVKGYYRDVIEFINNCHRPILAVDIPSGLNADTGQPCGVCIQATATATFAFAKIGHVTYPGAQYCGQVAVIDIGIPPALVATAQVAQRLITPSFIAKIMGTRTPDTHKGRTGHLLVIAGATGKTGAAALTATSALRVGAGLVTLGMPESLNPILEALLVESMTLPLPDQGTGLLLEEAFTTLVTAIEGKRAVALGPGLGTASQTRSMVSRILREIDLPMVIDADGLNNLVGNLGWLKSRRHPTILTPHPGEMARLTNMTPQQIQQDRVSAARNLAKTIHVFVVLKGARTIVAEPNGQVWINPTGNPGMAAGGMGDVLTGVIAGLLSQGFPASEACLAGVYLHGLAADILADTIPRGYLASEVMQAIPRAIQKILTDPPAGPLTCHF